jgi:hypothetical protein
MKTRERFILAALVLVLVAALVAQAIMSGGRSGFTNDPNVAALVAQTTTSRGDDQSRPCIEKASPNGKITDRVDFFAGAMFAQVEMGKMRNEAFRTFCDRERILPGLEGVQVEVVRLRPGLEKYGLTQQLLQTDTELRLRQHGIRIFTDEEANQSIVEQDKKGRERASAKGYSIGKSLDPKDSDEHFLQCLRECIENLQRTSSPPPTLVINVNPAVLEDSGRAAFSIEVELHELACVLRNRASCLAATWQTGSVGACSSDDLKEYVRESLRDHLDKFINAYLAANPKDRSVHNVQER